MGRSRGGVEGWGEVAKHVSRAGWRVMSAGPWRLTSSNAVPWKRLCLRLSSDFLKILMA